MKKLFTILAVICSINGFAQTNTATWYGVLKIAAQELTLQLHVDEAKKEVLLDVLEQGAEGQAMEVVHLTSDSIHVTIPNLMLNYQGKVVGDSILGTFRQGMFKTSLNMTRGEVKYNRPQEPTKPYPYQTMEVMFSNKEAGITLFGTLTLPVDYKGKRVPVVLMVTGSGPQNRDEELFGHKPFLVIADRLARNGIASLRYDDRGVGASDGTFENATTDDFKADAQAGVAYLRNLKMFSKVGILGHSEGGTIAYMLASERKTDFIVSLAGPACRIDTMMVEQINGLASSQGATTKVVQSVADAKRVLKVDNNVWLRHFFELDITPYISKISCPVLSVYGDVDRNVPASMNVPILRQNLSPKKHNITKVYPGLSHMFQHNATGNPMKTMKIEETFSEEVLKDIYTWINSL